MPRTELTLGPKTLSMFGSCKNEGFPLCLDQAVVRIFGHRNVVTAAATRGGFKRRNMLVTRDVWESYYDYLRSLEKILGRGPEAVIEHQSIREIEAFGCTECPIYQHGRIRDKGRFSQELPPKAEVRRWVEPHTSAP